MGINMNYEVKRMGCLEGRSYIVENHYSRGCHGRPMCWGLYDKDDVVNGVIAFATPSSEYTRSFLFGPQYKDKVTELHRMHIRDNHEKNLNTWFIARALDGIKEYRPNIVAVLSFADPNEGHLGTVYQASNAIYLGRTREEVFYRDKEGFLHHPRKNGINITFKMAEERGWVKEKRAPKHRYLLLVGSRREKRWALSNLLVQALPYPKSL